MPALNHLCRVLIRVVLCLSLLVTATPMVHAQTISAHEIRVDGLLKRMTLEQKVGQLFLVFFNGQILSPSLLRSIREYHVGGIVFFQGNIASAQQTAALINEAQREAISGTVGVPLFVAADQEGGLIARMPPPAPAFPSQMALGATGDGDLAARVAQAQSRVLKALEYESCAGARCQ
jgi:beta-N-acetylhexosaminidase